RNLFMDQAGNIWFECGRGLSTFDGKQVRPVSTRTYLRLKTWPSNTQGLWFKGDEIHGYNDRDQEAGVYHLQEGQLNFYPFPTQGFRADQAFYSVSTGFVRGQNNQVWFGTYGCVFGYDGVDFQIIDSDFLNLDASTGFLHVRSIYEDTKGDLWIGNNGLGVFHSNGDTVRYFSKELGLTTLGSEPIGGSRSGQGTMEHVFAIGEDAEGNIWFGDRDTGAWKYDGKTMSNYGVQDGLTTSHIWQIYVTPDRELWLAMGDGAVCRFNGSGFDRVF
ncbi:MAG: two-component regulator propeller domain-containing protein, partial [Bacteroidota bacterium]